MEQRPGETQVEIRAGESLFTLHSLPAVDFPQIPAFSGEGFSVSKPAFIETVDRVAPSASRDETRPVLTGVLIHFAKNSVRMVATDSYRLSVKETPVESSLAEKFQAIVPARTLLELSRIATAVADDTITILPTENQMLFRVGGISLVSRLIDGQFPNYRQLIPETFDYEVAVDHDELLEAIRRVGLSGPEECSPPPTLLEQQPHRFRGVSGRGQGARGDAHPVLGRRPGDRFQPRVP